MLWIPTVIVVVGHLKSLPNQQGPRGSIRCDYLVVTCCSIVNHYIGTLSSVKILDFRHSKITRDGRTDGRTDGPTDQRTDIPSYRDARRHLKTLSIALFWWNYPKKRSLNKRFCFYISVFAFFFAITCIHYLSVVHS